MAFALVFQQRKGEDSIEFVFSLLSHFRTANSSFNRFLKHMGRGDLNARSSLFETHIEFPTSLFGGKRRRKRNLAVGRIGITGRVYIGKTKLPNSR